MRLERRVYNLLIINLSRKGGSFVFDLITVIDEVPLNPKGILTFLITYFGNTNSLVKHHCFQIHTQIHTHRIQATERENLTNILYC